jgi:cell division protease FtsH
MTRKPTKKQNARSVAKKTRGSKKHAVRKRAPALRHRGDLIPVVEGMIGLKPPEIAPDADQEKTLPPAAQRQTIYSARCAIVLPPFLRATARAVRRQLKDAPSGLVVVVLVPAPGWIEPVKKLFLVQFGPRWEVVTDANNKTPQQKSDRDREVAMDLSRRKSMVGFATHAEALPSVLTAAADLTIRMQPLDGATISRAIRLFTGRRSSVAVDEKTVLGLDFHHLLAAFCTDASPAQIIARLQKQAAGMHGGPGATERLPALETAFEYGPARVWGLDLARDIADFKAGRITWEAIDRGAVLFSEPGCGKSLFARILANACQSPLVAYSIADLFASSAGYLDSVIKSSRAMFAKAASLAAPCCIMALDEIDALPNRATMSNRAADWWIPVVTDFLLNLDDAVAGKRAGIVVLGMTNNIRGVDAAIMRPGRLERAIEVTRPDQAGILNILRYHLHTSLTGADLTEVGHLLVGSTAAEIMMKVRAARRIARYANRDLVLDDLVQSIAPIEDIAPDALMRISIHESGHAIGSLAVPSGVLQRCIIGSTSNSAGRTMIAMETDDLLTRDSVERRAVALLCARAAEALLIGSVGLGSGGDENSDLAQVTQLVATLHASTGLCGTLTYVISYQDALQAVRADLKLRARVEAHLRKLQARADEIVRRHRDAIIAVAHQLRLRRHLSGDEIRRIFEATAPSLPTQAFEH